MRRALLLAVLLTALGLCHPADDSVVELEVDGAEVQLRVFLAYPLVEKLDDDHDRVLSPAEVTRHQQALDELLERHLEVGAPLRAMPDARAVPLSTHASLGARAALATPLSVQSTLWPEGAVDPKCTLIVKRGERSVTAILTPAEPRWTAPTEIPWVLVGGVALLVLAAVAFGVKRLLVVLLLCSPARAHLGDHVFAGASVQGRTVILRVDVPMHMLADLDRNGDLLLDSEEASLAGKVQLASLGVSVPGSLALLPPVVATPDNPVERTNAMVTLESRFTFPWPVRQVELRSPVVPDASQAECTYRVDGLGQRQQVPFKPGQGWTRFGAGPAWPVILLGASDLAALLCLAALRVAGRGSLPFLGAYLAVRALQPAWPVPSLLVPLALAVLAYRLMRTSSRLPLSGWAALTGALLAWQQAFQLTSWPAAGLYGLGLGVGLLLALGLARALRSWPVLAGPLVLAALVSSSIAARL